MTLTRKVFAVGAVAAGLLAVGATAAAAAVSAAGSAAGQDGGHRSLADVQHRVDQRADKLTARATAARGGTIEAGHAPEGGARFTVGLLYEAGI
jgi:hypothetical protein